MVDIPEWTTDPDRRGYDHPKDRMRFDGGLVSAPRSEANEPLFTEEQGYKAVERLLLPREYRNNAVEAIGRVAMGCLSDSDKWEALNLSTIDSLSDGTTRVLDEYRRFSGNAHNVAGFINWFANTTLTLPVRPAGMQIVNHEGQIQKGEFITDEKPNDNESALDKSPFSVNGYTLTLGTANQIPGYSGSSSLNKAMSSGLRNIVRPRYGFEVGIPEKDCKRHRVELIELGDEGWQTRDGDILLHVVRERGIKNYLRIRGDGADRELQILYGIKRFHSFVALRGVELVRDIMRVLTTEKGTIVDDKRTPELRRIMQEFETTIRRQGRSRTQQDIRVVPLLTTQLLRDPKKHIEL